METCCSCLKPKAALACGLCGSDVCKSCTQILNEEDFAYVKAIPVELAHAIFCPNCFNEKIAPETAAYHETLEQAKGIIVFMKDQGKETRLIKRKQGQLKVVDCDDYDETIMRLAFQAASIGHNAIVDVDVNGRKFRHGSYQTTKFTGTATPVTIDPRRYDSDRPHIANPN